MTGPFDFAALAQSAPLKFWFRPPTTGGMDKNTPAKPNCNDPMWDAAQAIENSVRAIRKARGKKNPEDCVPGSAEHEVILDEFLNNMLTSLGDHEDETDGFGAGAAG